MKNNKGIKFVFLIIAIMSLSIIIASVPATFGLANQSPGVVSSYMHDKKRLIEDDFYKSKAFDEATIRPLVYQLTKSIQGRNDLQEVTEKAFEKEKKAIRKQLEQYKNIRFMAINNETGELYTNTDHKDKNEFVKKAKGYCLVEIKSRDYYTEYTKTIGGIAYENADVNGNIGDLVQTANNEIYISIPAKLVGGDEVYWNYNQFERDAKQFSAVAILDIVSLIVFIVSVVIFKRIKADLFDKESKVMDIYNKIPIEIILVVLLPVLWIYRKSFNPYYFEFGLIFINVVATFILIIMAYVIIKQIKSIDKISTITNNSIAVRGIRLIKNGICKVGKATKKIPLIKRIIALMIICVVVYIVVIGFLSWHFSYYWGWYVSPIKSVLIAISFIIPVTVFGCYIIRKLAYLSEIMEGTKRIKDGDLSYKISVEGNDNFTMLAENINNIGEGLDNSIDKQLRSERMKSELITNVSHDLKTPLTSIINYIELIKKEENIEPDYIKDYVNVLDSKSKRLKILIEDLFEASKASSGNIELNMEKIDLNQLLRQSIGEVEEKISESKLDIRVNIPEEKIFIQADGKRLYRVLENVLSNVVKYSLENTRVYIDLIVEDGKVRLTTKNISSYELNFDPQEIMERFKRGDEARNTEGSGLGLAIARDLVSIQGGVFSIEIDGDLFKSIIEFDIEK